MPGTGPAGLHVQAMMVDGEGRTAAYQDYHLEEPCGTGGPCYRALTLETASPLTHVRVYVTADPGGPSQAADQVTATRAEDGSIRLTR